MRTPTGFKDRGGADLFEGDIVSQPAGSWGQLFKELVFSQKFDQFMLRSVSGLRSDGLRLPEWRSATLGFFDKKPGNKSSQYTLRGNSIDNPELVMLKGEPV